MALPPAPARTPDTIRAQLDAPFAIAPAIRAHFERHGFAHLRDVLSPALLAHYGDTITDLTLDLDPLRGTALENRDTYGKAFVQVVNLWLKSHRVREFVFGRRLARIAADLLGVAGVRLWHDQALYKLAGGGVTPWHADQYYWPMDTDRSVTAWVPLQDTPLAMGPLSFAAGSHRLEAGRDFPIGDAGEQALQDLFAGGICEIVREPFALGDVSFHLGRTFHRADPNTLGEPRRVMTIIYMDADMRLAPPENANQEADRRAFAPGIPPGAIMDTPMTPVLWQATHA